MTSQQSKNPNAVTSEGVSKKFNGLDPMVTQTLEKPKKVRIKPSDVWHITTDSEWHDDIKDLYNYTDKDQRWLSTQFHLVEENLTYTYVRVEDYFTLKPYADKLGIELVPFSNPDEGILIDFCRRVGIEFGTVDLMIFFSPRDLRYAVGKMLMEELYLSEAVTKKRRIENKKPIPLTSKLKMNIVDLNGWTNQGLAGLAESVGYEMTDKGDLDDYKHRMSEAIYDVPETFLRYGRGDVTCLHPIYENFIELVRRVQGVVGISDEDKFTASNIPGTVGSIGARNLANFIRSQAKDKFAYDLAYLKPGILDRTNNRWKSARDASNKAFGTLTKQYTERTKASKRLGKKTVSGSVVREIIKADEYKPLFDEVIKSRYAYAYNLLNQCSVDYFARQHDSSVFLSIVMGGRCVNEMPEAYKITGAVLDIDLNSCYGTALRSLTSPVGLPTVWSKYDEEETVKLGDWLKRNESELVDDLYTIMVDGELNFYQDLIFSKDVTAGQINRVGSGGNYEKGDSVEQREDVSHIPGDMVLSRSEIKNGIITSDILKTIRAVATNQELEGFMSLEVVTAAYYPKSKRVDDFELLQDTILSDPGKRYVKNNQHGNTVDTRSKVWYALPLERYIGKLIDERKRAKKAGEQAYQNMLKLFINITYGVLASPYFEVGNTVVANVITARARLGAWMMSKALRTRQSITDGGAYDPREVAYLKPGAKKPGFKGLHDIARWFDRKNYTRVLIDLPGCPHPDGWEAFIRDMSKRASEKEDIGQLEKEVGEIVDRCALTHVNNFWSVYGLALPFDVEHKVSNTSTKMAYVSKGHYAFETYTGKRKYKIRGTKDFRGKKGITGTLQNHPTYSLFDSILDGDETFPSVAFYDHFYLLSPPKWKQAKESAGYEHLKEKHPGDEVVEKRTGRYNNTHTFIFKMSEHRTRSGRKTIHRNKPVQFFEKHAKEGTPKVIRRMNDDRL